MFQNVVIRGFVVRQIESMVVVVIFGDFVEVLQVVLEFLGFDVGNGFFGCERIGCEDVGDGKVSCKY